MNILKRFLFVSLAGLLITSLGLTAGVPDKSAWGSGLTGLESNYENIKFADEELDVFLKAKDYVFKRYWRKAKEQLEFYLKKYPSGQLRAEALYWLAQSLNRISKDEVDKDKVIALKEEAVQKLELLIGQYPESVWTDDAQELRVEIAGELALIGRTEYKSILQHIYETEKKTETDLKLVALNSLIELEPEAAIPILKEIIETDKDPQVRKKVVLLLGKTYTQGVITLLEDVSKNDPDREVREEAFYWLEQVKNRSIPVNLHYYLFSAQLTDPSELKRIPENRMNYYTLPRIKRRDEERAKKEIMNFFNGKISDLERQSHLEANVLMAMFGSSFYSKLHGFLINFPTEGFKKTYDLFSGKVHFKDLETGKDYDAPFTADDKNETLLAMRHGNDLVLMFLQFESQLEPDLEEETEAEPVYSTDIRNMLGCRVLSARKSWESKEQSADLIDFGQAKAEIPDKKGTWTLKGYIMMVKKERRFIARRAVLTDPQGKIVARADQIIVPVDNPSQYKATGKKDQ
ncbi:MAG: HEAT repeat domain-containing protein [Candidatus Aminicenantes bacterium]|nr:HEAT repeat domain-containing protein [Candidatus Aminicenantes bacterium]